MKISSTALSQVLILDPEKHKDNRGYFARAYCQRELSAHGVHVNVVQANISANQQRGTLRGMHLQLAPSAEGKIIRCNSGRMVDVALDLRPESASYMRHLVVELDADEGRALYVPPGVAHGFLTLQDGTDILYLMTDYFAPDLAVGFRWNDPVFGISWPIEPLVISERDQSYPDFDSAIIAHRNRRSSPGSLQSDRP